MQITSRSKTIAFFIVLSSLLVGVAIALNVTWILHWRGAVQLAVGIVLFSLIIAGLILNTIFLVREIRRNEQHDSFLNAVTHELRTPIASIRLYLETLQSRDVAEEKRQDFYRIMHQDTDRLMSSVDQVLRAAETVQTRRKQHWVAVDMAELVDECVAAARERHHIGVDALSSSNHGLQPQDAMVMGDVDELRIAVTNLLDNAVKYSPEGVSIGVDLMPLGDELLLQVSDQGIGIPPADLKRIFKRFYRAAWGRNRVKGTGLGLFIVRTIVKKHRGSVSADSKGEGKGATITLRLPRQAAR
jgi:signal transduction histidine kinase